MRKIKKRLNKYFKEKADKIVGHDLFIPVDNTEEQDIFVCGYPKSGNTWMQSVIASLYYGMSSENVNNRIAQELVVDVHSRRYYKRFDKISFFKSHHLPQKKYNNVIYIVREGKDVITSYYHYLHILNKGKDVNSLIDSEEFLYPCYWHKHIESWLNNPYNAKIIYIRYEDLLNDFVKVMEKLCVFLDITRTKEELIMLSENLKIDKMRTDIYNSGGMGEKKFMGEKSKKFFRKGTNGDYQNLMSEAQIEKFNEYSKNALRKFGYL